MSQSTIGNGYHLVFPIGKKNTNFAEDVEFLLSVTFWHIPLRGFREVEILKSSRRTTDDGHVDHNSASEPSAHVH